MEAGKVGANGAKFSFKGITVYGEGRVRPALLLALHLRRVELATLLMGTISYPTKPTPPSNRSILSDWDGKTQR